MLASAGSDLRRRRVVRRSTTRRLRVERARPTPTPRRRRGGARRCPRREPVPPLDASRSRRALETLPTVATGRRSPSRLPDTLVVDRRASACRSSSGRSATRRYLVDGTAPLFGRARRRRRPAAAAGLPVDRRSAGRVEPAWSVGSRARPGGPRRRHPAGLARAWRRRQRGQRRWPSRVTDENGFVRPATRPGGWSAVFGFYTPSLRTPAIIPGQVRLLRSLLVGREPVIAGSSSHRDRRHVPPRATPRPSPTSSPTP